MKNLLELGKLVNKWYIHSISDAGLITFRSTPHRAEADTLTFFNTDTGQSEELYTPSGGDTIYASAVMRKITGKMVKDPKTGKMVNQKITKTKKELMSYSYSKNGEKVFQVDTSPTRPDGEPLFVVKGEMCRDYIRDEKGNQIGEKESDTFQWLKMNT